MASRKVRPDKRTGIRVKNEVDAEQYFIDAGAFDRDRNEYRVQYLTARLISLWQQAWQLFPSLSRSDREEYEALAVEVDYRLATSESRVGVILRRCGQVYEKYSLSRLPDDERLYIAAVYLWACLTGKMQWHGYAAKHRFGTGGRWARERSLSGEKSYIRGETRYEHYLAARAIGEGMSARLKEKGRSDDEAKGESSL